LFSLFFFVEGDYIPPPGGAPPYLIRVDRFIK